MKDEKWKKLEERRLQKLKSRIENDFKRFLELERAYIINISHIVLSVDGGFLHNDRKELRNELFKHLNKIIQKETNE